MDTVGAPAIAAAMGISLPTVHRLLDAEGIPRTGRGRPRAVPLEVAERVQRARGTSPVLTIPAVEGRILAVLLRAPLGLASARRVAERAGISPTTASVHLHALRDAGLVTRQRRRVAEGRAIERDEWRLDTGSPRWRELAPQVRRIRLPERSDAVVDSLPDWLTHHFWNADPTALTMHSDGAYVARRLLNSGDASAMQWALKNADPSQLLDAVAGRGADARTKALVHNWIRA